MQSLGFLALLIALASMTLSSLVPMSVPELVSHCVLHRALDILSCGGLDGVLSGRVLVGALSFREVVLSSVPINFLNCTNTHPAMILTLGSCSEWDIANLRHCVAELYCENGPNGPTIHHPNPGLKVGLGLGITGLCFLVGAFFCVKCWGTIRYQLRRLWMHVRPLPQQPANVLPMVNFNVVNGVNIGGVGARGGGGGGGGGRGGGGGGRGGGGGGGGRGGGGGGPGAVAGSPVAHRTRARSLGRQ